MVFAFGSVPLKTYLPDGDVDITILGNTALDSSFISDVRGILEMEEQDDGAELELKGLQFIDAEVKLIKCVIDNIVVDISFNQIGGVSTLCFLELVDHEVGKNHLFKRSIMLIKAWCYHESRILGAHHGLISTYALETLVVYIFNMFHKSLHSPLEALYKFLEYFSKFDWDKYCISLNGPVALSTLPSLIVEHSSIHDEFFGKEIPEDLSDRLIVLPEVSDESNMNFRLKYLNIIDPLKWSNNLGRSVSRGSFYRIRGAFSFGAQKLGQILMLPSDLIPTEILGFFENTLKSHGRGRRSDVGSNGSSKSSLCSEYTLGEDASDSKESGISEDENKSPDQQRISDGYFRGDAQDRPWNKIWFTNSDIQYYNVSGDFFSGRSSFSPENGNNMKRHCRDNYAREENLPPSRSSMEQHIEANNQSHILTPSTRINTLDVSNSCPEESNRSDLHEEKLPLSPFSSSNLLDLSGDLDLQLECLRKVQYHLESMFDGLVQEACFSGPLNNDSRIPTTSFSNTDQRPSGPLSISSAGTERRNFSPGCCSHNTGDISQKSVSHTNDQVNAVSPSTSANSENHPVSRFQSTQDNVRTHGTGMGTLNNASLLSGTDILSNAFSQLYHAVDSESYQYCRPYVTTDESGSRGTGSYIPTMNYYYTYKEHVFSYSDKGKRQREVLPHRPVKIKTKPTYSPRHNSPEMGCSSASNGGFTVEGGSAQEKSPTNRVTKLSATNQPWNGHNSQHGYVCSKVNTIDSQRPATNEGLIVPNNESREISILPASQVRNKEITASSSSSRIDLRHCVGNGQGNFQESNTSSPATELVEGLEFGSFGPISPIVVCEKFREEFPPLPSRKMPAVALAPVATPVSSSPAATGSKPEGSYQLRDEADFPPLGAGSRNASNRRVGG
uniref:PAP/OAS1 substrate-binding-related domain-containing protein n=1 Tax=Oryza brachyantha TaxID=4533 RepID=J3MP51_ORYBR